jgi:hypothetical protein
LILTTFEKGQKKKNPLLEKIRCCVVGVESVMSECVVGQWSKVERREHGFDLRIEKRERKVCVAL